MEGVFMRHWLLQLGLTNVLNQKMCMVSDQNTRPVKSNPQKKSELSHLSNSSFARPGTHASAAALANMYRENLDDYGESLRPMTDTDLEDETKYLMK
jgi:cytoskeletal protein RodZ